MDNVIATAKAILAPPPVPVPPEPEPVPVPEPPDLEKEALERALAEATARLEQIAALAVIPEETT
jgi:hypothetical protein